MMLSRHIQLTHLQKVVSTTHICPVALTKYDVKIINTEQPNPIDISKVSENFSNCTKDTVELPNNSFSTQKQTNEIHRSQDNFSKVSIQRTNNVESHNLPARPGPSERAGAPTNNTLIASTPETSKSTEKRKTPRHAKNIWSFEIRNIT